MAYPYNDLYKVFNDELISRYDIDWFDVYKTYIDIGNFCGLYPDTALLLMTLVMQTPVRSVIEFGSGASSLFLAKACIEKGIDIKSYEEKGRYFDMARKLVSSYAIDPSFMKSYPDGEVDLGGVDMVFMDSSEVQRIALLKSSESLLDVPLIVMDDFGSPGLALAFSNFIRRCKSDRPFYVYNGVGRQDRHQIISWIPEKIAPIREIIDSNLPRIGVS